MMRSPLCAAICVLAFAVGLTAQTRTAAVEGTVRDPSGGVIADAAVTLRDPETNQTRAVRTDHEGSFRISEIPVGTYALRVDYDGFAPYVHTGVVLAIGQTARLDVELGPASVTESVAVSAQPPPLDRQQTAMATSIDTERIEELPVRSRNYLEFVLLAPGVTRAPAGSAQTGTAAASLPDSGFSFGGLRPRSNTLTIDGLDNNDEFGGASRTELSLEIVREFQVVTNGWSAENGGASGGAINVVTKSGANTVHGDAFLFGQSGALNARPALEETAGVKPSLRRYRGGLAIGGPVARDRTFYYAAAEREQANGQAASDIDPAVASSINGALGRGLLPQIGTRQLAVGLFPTERAETEWSAKITHQRSQGGAIVARIAGTNNRDENDGFNAGGLSDLSARGTSDTRDTAFTSSWTQLPGRLMTNELRGQLAGRRVELRSFERRGAGASIGGVAEFGVPYAGNNTHDQTYVEIGDAAGIARGSHFLKVGGDVRHVAVTSTTADGLNGIYTFRTLDAFLNGRPDSYRQRFGVADVALSVTRMSAFVQDHWTPHSSLTIDLGARFDGAVTPSIDVTNRQVSPRVGVAWMPGGQWVVRGGAGTFADRMVLAAFERAWRTDNARAFERIFDGALAAAALPAASLPSIDSVRRGGWNPSSRQMSIGAERQLTSNLTASINYVAVQGRNLPRTVNVNLLPPVAPGASQELNRPVFGDGRLDPRFDAVFEVQPTASSSYRGVTATLNRRLADEIEWSAAYTWSRARDDASDFDEQPQNPYRLDDEWSASRYDQRHRFVASALFELPIGDEEDRRPDDPPPGPWIKALSHIEVAPILTIGSGHPANAITGGDDSRTRAFPFTARPLNVGRNALRLPATTTLDVRLLKYFTIRPHGKLDLVVEVFNLLNRTNVTQVNGVFGRAIDAGPMRHIQMSVDFEF